MKLNRKRQFADTSLDMVELGIFYIRRSRVLYAGIAVFVALATLSACGPDKMVSKDKNGTTGTGQSVSIYSGTIDTSFYSQTTPSTAGVNARIKKTVQASDGRFYALGEITVRSSLQFSIEKRLSDGSLDPTLGSGGRVLTNIGGADTPCSELMGSTDTLTPLAGSNIKAIEASDLLLGADTVMIAATLEVNYAGTGASGNGTRKRMALLTYNSQGLFVSCNTYSGKLSGEADSSALYFGRDVYVKSAALSVQQVFLVGVVGQSGVTTQLSDFSQPSKLYSSKWQLGAVQVMASNGTYDSAAIWGRFSSDPVANERMRDFIPIGSAVVGGKLMIGGTKYLTSSSTYTTQLAATRLDVSSPGNIKPDSQYKVTGDTSAGGSVLFTSTSGYVARSFAQNVGGSFFFAGDLPSQADGSYFVTRLSPDATTIDSRFGNSGGVFKGKQGAYNNRATSIYFEPMNSSVQPKVVVAVEVAQSNGGTSTSDTYALDDLRDKKLMLVRLTSTGILDTSFASSSSAPGTSLIDFTAIGLPPDQVSQSTGFSILGDNLGYVVGGQLRLKATPNSVNALLTRVVR